MAEKLEVSKFHPLRTISINALLKKQIPLNTKDLHPLNLKSTGQHVCHFMKSCHEIGVTHYPVLQGGA